MENFICELMENDFTLKTGKSIVDIIYKAKGRYNNTYSKIDDSLIDNELSFDNNDKIWLGYNNLVKLEGKFLDKNRYDAIENEFKKLTVFSEKFNDVNLTNLSINIKQLNTTIYELEKNTSNSWLKQNNNFGDFYETKIIPIANIWKTYIDQNYKSIFNVINSFELALNFLFDFYYSENNFSLYFTVFKNVYMYAQIIVFILNSIIIFYLYNEEKNKYVKCFGNCSWFLSCTNIIIVVFVIIFAYLVGFTLVVFKEIIKNVTYEEHGKMTYEKYELCFHEYNETLIIQKVFNPNFLKQYRSDPNITYGVASNINALGQYFHTLSKIDSILYPSKKLLEKSYNQGNELLKSPLTLFKPALKIDDSSSDLTEKYGSIENVQIKFNSYIDYFSGNSIQLKYNCEIITKFEIKFNPDHCFYKSYTKDLFFKFFENNNQNKSYLTFVNFLE